MESIQSWTVLSLVGVKSKMHDVTLTFLFVMFIGFFLNQTKLLYSAKDLTDRRG